ncbi:MAG TPA: L-fucose:H+ symporter permease [Cytophagaceae bacterium]|nr:L-fucose:H+ symporter permease [Cytophagaceae bacterium]
MAGVSSKPGLNEVKLEEGKNYTVPLMVLTSLFFMWAVATNLNDILIPHLKKACDLTDFQSSLIQSAFFAGYFLLSLPAGRIITKVGYKNGILIGLSLCALGALLFIPAAATLTFGMFLFALCVLAGGISFLQVAANPYVAVLGPPETSSSRLNLAQAFNSLGATVGPYIGAKLILSNVEKTSAELAAYSSDQLAAYRLAEASMVKLPYLGLAGIFIALAVFIYFSNLPTIVEQSSEASTAEHVAKGSALNYSNLVFGVIAIFVYVGAEVGIGSFIIRYMQYLKIPDITEQSAASFISYYMFGAMTGRFIGSALMQKIKPNKILAFNAFVAFLLVISSVFSVGYTAVILVVLVGLMNSIMFPTIFTLAIDGLGKFTKDGSSYLIMAIVGGGIIPPIMGAISDSSNIQTAYIVPAICYLYILFYGLIGYKKK